MKRLKSLLSLALVLVMVLSLTIPAMAEGATGYAAAMHPITDGTTTTLPGNFYIPTNNSPEDNGDLDGALNALLDVAVYCVDTQTGTNYFLIEGSYHKNYTSDTEVQVTVFADKYVELYNQRTRGNYVLTSSSNSETVTLVKTDGKWALKARIAGPMTIRFDVTASTPTPGTGSYSITYRSSGSWPTGVSVPVDYKSYKYGDVVTLQAPSKTVIADYSKGGYWVFNGWSVYSDNNNYYYGTSSRHEHTSKCSYYNGSWHCDKTCWYYDGYDCNHSNCNYTSNSDWSYLDVLTYCRENGLRLSDLKLSDLPLNYKSTNSSSNSYKPSSTAVSSNSGSPYLTINCGHKNCTGKWCDVYCACDHDDCPMEYCKYWGTSSSKVCNHTSCPSGYCKYWSDCDYYDYYYGYYYGTQTITVTGNMTVYGSWSFQAAGGTLVLSASTLAASAYTPESYTFEIYSAANSTKPVKTFTVKAGSNQYISLDNGTYYVYAVNAKVAGYELDTTVSGDVSTDGAKIVINGNAVQVTYSNRYYEDSLELNTTDHIAYLAGYADGTVKPNDYITREQVATILYRLMTDSSRSMYQSSSNNFSDVKSNRWSNTAISTLVNAGVMKGTGNGLFQPAANMTRAELITALVNITGVSGGRTAFTDTAGHWASNAINAAASQGWITGYADGSFDPNGYLTRAEVVTIINRVLNRNPDSVADLINGMTTFSDNMQTTKWYYLDIQEAANGHNYKRDTDGTEYWTSLK